MSINPKSKIQNLKSPPTNGHEIDESRFEVLPVVHSMGVQIFDPCWAEREHASTDHELLHVISGTVELQIDGACYTTEPGDLLLVPAGVEHRDVFDAEEGLEVFAIFFDWAPSAEFFARVSNATLQAMPAHRKGYMAKILERQRGDVLGDTVTDRLIARSRVHTVLIMMLREALLPPPAGRSALAGRRRRTLMLAAKRYLDEHYTQPVTLDEIARALDISTFYLSHLFTEENDFSLSSYLTRLRMEKAHELLTAGRMNVSTVAQTVGYENGNYFSKIFRKHFGRPPSDFLGDPYVGVQDITSK